MKATTIHHPFKVGDVFVESWGYNQTNIDFYEVTKVTPKSVYIREIHARKVGHGHETRLLPDTGNFKRGGAWRPRHSSVEEKENPAVRKLVQSYGEGDNKRYYLNMTTYSNARPWDGETAFFDTIAAGYPGH